MNPQIQADIERALHRLPESIDTLVSDGLENGSMTTDLMAHVHYQASPFEYTETGIANYGYDMTTILKPFWGNAYAIVNGQLVERDEFTEAQGIIRVHVEGMDARRLLNEFVRR